MWFMLKDSQLTRPADPFHATVTEPRNLPISCDTTSGSLLHALIHGLTRRPGAVPSVLKIFIVAVAMTWLPLFVAACLSPLPIARRTPQLHLPFLYDWNVAFMFLVSFPVFLALTARDQNVLLTSLARVLDDGVLVVAESHAASVCALWKTRFRRINLAAQALGIITGLVVSVTNYFVYRAPHVGFWISSNGKLLPVGYVFLWCIGLFYTLIPIYVLRTVAISYFLRAIVEHAEINMLPFHPDQAGGLRPGGEIGLRNQYGLTVAGINVVLLIFTSLLYLAVPRSLDGLMIAAGIAYLVLGPIVFVGPLLPFRDGMMSTKMKLMSEVAQRLRVELHRLHGQLLNGQITRDDEELIDRLRKLGSVIDQLPVWPFDFSTLRKFVSAYIAPLLGAGLIHPLLTFVVNFLKTKR
jgi:hypothetical protein